jgi:CDGSH-type Zn-finger protein
VPAARAGQCEPVPRSLPAEPELPESARFDSALPDEPGAERGSGATITPYRDGPLIVRGSFRLLDQDGQEIDPGRQTIALCRCGKSGIKPFCDGSHKRAGFSAPSAPSRPRPAAQLRSGSHRDG